MTCPHTSCFKDNLAATFSTTLVQLVHWDLTCKRCAIVTERRCDQANQEIARSLAMLAGILSLQTPWCAAHWMSYSLGCSRQTACRLSIARPHAFLCPSVHASRISIRISKGKSPCSMFKRFPLKYSACRAGAAISEAPDWPGAACQLAHTQQVEQPGADTQAAGPTPAAHVLPAGEAAAACACTAFLHVICMCMTKQRLGRQVQQCIGRMLRSWHGIAWGETWAAVAVSGVCSAKLLYRDACKDM